MGSLFEGASLAAAAAGFDPAARAAGPPAPIPKPAVSNPEIANQRRRVQFGPARSGKVIVGVSRTNKGSGPDGSDGRRPPQGETELGAERSDGNDKCIAVHATGAASGRPILTPRAR